MQCHHFRAGECRSCPLIEEPYGVQLAEKARTARAALRALDETGRGKCDGGEAASSAVGAIWEPPVASAERGFRNKAKLVVSGRRGQVILGLGPVLAQKGKAARGKQNQSISAVDGIDLLDCPLYTPQLMAALPALRSYLNRTGIRPYNVATDSGELKYLLVSAGTSGEVMARIVLRTPRPIGRLRSELAHLQRELPQLRVLSANIQPLHAAIIEGPEEYLLTDIGAINAPLGSLHLREIPGAFFQTNDQVATCLYETARAWVTETVHEPARGLRIWDLYCGVGGFALALAGPGRTVIGVEVSEAAVLAAREAAGMTAPAKPVKPAAPISVMNLAAGVGQEGSAVRNATVNGGGVAQPARGGTEFVQGDAIAWAQSQDLTKLHNRPDLIVVNPPRRGIGADLCKVIIDSGAPWLLYSSCNVNSLARDLEQLPQYRMKRAKVLDMFPHTKHFETLVLLERDC